MDTDTWLAQYKDKVSGLKQAAAELERDLAASTATVSSADESVTVTIGPNGSLRDVVFSQRAAEHSPAALAALLMKTVARGQRAVAEQVAAAFAPVAEGTSAMALLTSFAPPADAGAEPEEQLPPNRYDELAAGVPDAPPPPVPPAPAPLPPPVAPQPVRVVARPRRATDAGDDADFADGRPW